MRISIKKIFEFVIIFLLILDTGSVPSIFFGGGLICVFILVLSLCYTILSGNKILRSQLRLLVVFGLFFLISSSFTHTNFTLYFGAIIRVLAVIFTYTAFRNDVIAIRDALTRVLWVIAYLGLVNLFLINFLPMLFSLRVAESGFSINTLLYIFNYHSFIQLGPIALPRNQGAFWEPGVFQIPMNLLVYLLLIEKKESWGKALIPMIMVFSTFSTTGLLVMSLIILFKICRERDSLSLREKFLILLFAVAFTPFVYNNTKEKLTGDINDSAAARTYDLYMGLDIIGRNPIWGIGPDKDKYLAQTQDISIGFYDDNDISIERGNTNTIMSLMCYLGVPFSLFFLGLLYNQTIFSDKKQFFIILIILLFSEPLYGTMFLYFLSMTAKIKKPLQQYMSTS